MVLFLRLGTQTAQQLKVCIEAAQAPSNNFSTGNSAMATQVAYFDV